MNTTEIKEILGKYGVAPDKALGQNFLINQGVLKKIVEAAEIQKTTEVLEIGPGLGALTRVLAREAKHVVAVEKDPLFVEIL
ncbi:MAG: rRNA adenine N-6-methyltransferase family protein, partial [Candidatus Yanofskybacteria bacterium]|nr:rRNA adenine N-6-methyltransferase family protein [Candidatus Yanofskybacteria bacterium]